MRSYERPSGGAATPAHTAGRQRGAWEQRACEASGDGICGHASQAPTAAKGDFANVTFHVGNQALECPSDLEKYVSENLKEEFKGAEARRRAQLLPNPKKRPRHEVEEV